MSGAQLHLALGFPSFAALAGILVNAGYLVFLNGCLSRVEHNLDTLTGMAVEVVNRLVRIEDKPGIVPR